MARNIIIRWRIHFLICVGILAISEELFICIVYRKVWAVILGVVYIIIMRLFKLTDFHNEAFSYTIPTHIILSMVVCVFGIYVGFSYIAVGSLFAILNFIYLMWLLFADIWIQFQISASATILVDDTGEIKVWADKHNKMYHIVERYYEEDIKKIEADIRTFKIPMILTGIEPSVALMQLAGRFGVMVHYVSKDRKPDNCLLVENHRFPGLFTYTPEPW